MNYFPLFIRLRDRRCLVVGGGQVAFRKINWLVKAGAKITVMATEINAGLQDLEKAGMLDWVAGEISVSELSLQGYYLVVAATDNENLNSAIAGHAAAQGVHCNVASNADDGDVILPSIIDRDPLVVALHSGGKSPTVTRYLKRQLEAFIPRDIARLVSWAEQWRSAVKSGITGILQRQRFWDRLLSGVAAESVMSGDRSKADQVLRQRLGSAAQGHTEGEVFLVGAGPGDPELLTLKALRLIQQADVVLYDRLVSEPILDLLPNTCERIYVGKRQADHALPQTDINQTLVDLAKQGRNVLRLKGGDPFIFGRGGEEIELLADNDVSFQVVPGITAASGCAAYSGIPLTHRDYSQSVRFVTGHLKSDETNLPWPELAQERQTLVFYMGLTGLERICRSLIEHGRHADTPAAIIERGTTPNQRVITATLATLAAEIDRQVVKAPTLLLIGEVVNLHERLQWYKTGG
ncbi:MAG: siroheme synthase CysG [Cellvibrionaceae bacterium]